MYQLLSVLPNRRTAVGSLFPLQRVSTVECLCLSRQTTPLDNGAWQENTQGLISRKTHTTYMKDGQKQEHAEIEEQIVAEAQRPHAERADSNRIMANGKNTSKITWIIWSPAYSRWQERWPKPEERNRQSMVRRHRSRRVGKPPICFPLLEGADKWRRKTGRTGSSLGQWVGSLETTNRPVRTH